MLFSIDVTDGNMKKIHYIISIHIFTFWEDNSIPTIHKALFHKLLVITLKIAQPIPKNGANGVKCKFFWYLPLKIFIALRDVIVISIYAFPPKRTIFPIVSARQRERQTDRDKHRHRHRDRHRMRMRMKILVFSSSNYVSYDL